MIAAIQKMKSSLASALFAVVLLSSAPVVAHDAPAVKSESNSSYLTWTNAALFTFFLAQVRLWTREGDTSPVKYNLDELAAGENVANNLYYLVDDGVIGHFGKKPYLTVDTDNQRVEVQLADAEDANGKPIKDAQGNKVKVSTACYPKGLLGWGAYYLKPVLGAMGTAYAIKFLLETLQEANAANKPFATVFFEKLKSINSALPKMTDIGVIPAVNIAGAVAGTK